MPCPEFGAANVYIPQPFEPEWIEGVNCWSRGPDFPINCYVTIVPERNPMNFRPLGDRVIVEPEAMEKQTASGIILPDSAQANSQRGTVIAVGPGRITDDGVLVPMSVKVNDVVQYGWGGNPLSVDGKEKYLCLKESDILAVVDA